MPYQKTVTRYLIIKKLRSSVETRIVMRKPTGLSFNEWAYQIDMTLPEERLPLAAPPIRLALPNPLAPIVNIGDVRA